MTSKSYFRETNIIALTVVLFLFWTPPVPQILALDQGTSWSRLWGLESRRSKAWMCCLEHYPLILALYRFSRMVMQLRAYPSLNRITELILQPQVLHPPLRHSCCCSAVPLNVDITLKFPLQVFSSTAAWHVRIERNVYGKARACSPLAESASFCSWPWLGILLQLLLKQVAYNFTQLAISMQPARVSTRGRKNKKK